MKYTKIKNSLGAVLLSAVMCCGSAAVTAVVSPVTAYAAETASAKKLAAPKGFSYQVNADTVRLSWNAVEGADAYKVLQYDSAKGTYVAVKTVKATSCEIDGLKNSTTYKFKVRTLVEKDGKYVSQKTSGVIKCKTAAKNKKDGWYKKGDSRVYYQDGFMMKSCTAKVNGKLYLFGKNGQQLKNGIYDIGGCKYSVDKNGVVAASKWISTKNKDKQYYAGKDGKLTCYEVTDEYLYIDGKIANTDDIIPERTAFTVIKVNNTYYQFITYHDYIHPNDEEYYAKGIEIYDVLSHRKIGECYGSFDVADNGKIKSGAVYNLQTKKLMTFKSGSAAITDVAAPIVIYKAECADGAGDTVNARVNIFNLSGKDISSIVYKSYAKDEDGNILTCQEQGDTEQNLNMPTAVKAGDKNETFWRSFMTNDDAEILDIVEVKITYADGTTEILTGDRIVIAR